MSDAPERDTVINLLERLGSEQDEDVLAAARELHTQITDAGMDWQDLLVGDEPVTTSVTPEDADNSDDFEIDVDHDAVEPATKFVGDEAKTPELIDKLLAREGISEVFREELEDYKIDLANGDFEPNDHHYIAALYARLTK
ncbi:hypothetical protein OAJ57_03755 [Alphaproteobacteria bacterium]|nr:hypothetical protein [Alphaproteobacteria bacterium]